MARTKLDFSKHVFTHEIHGAYTKYDLKKPDSDYIYRVSFLTGEGVTLITAAWGMWCVKKELHPSPGGYISDHYIAEKIDNRTTGQAAEEVDEEATRALLESYLDGTHEDLEDDPLTDGERYYLECCLEDVDENEVIYTITAYSTDRCGRFSDAEDVTKVLKIKHYLLCIFDAYEEMCKRLKDE